MLHTALHSTSRGAYRALYICRKLLRLYKIGGFKLGWRTPAQRLHLGRRRPQGKAFAYRFYVEMLGHEEWKVFSQVNTLYHDTDLVRGHSGSDRVRQPFFVKTPASTLTHRSNMDRSTVGDASGLVNRLGESRMCVDGIFQFLVGGL